MINWNVYSAIVLSWLGGALQVSTNWGFYNLLWAIPLIIYCNWLAQQDFFNKFLNKRLENNGFIH